MAKIEKIVVALEMDFDEGNAKILDYARTMAERHNASLHLLNVMVDFNRYAGYMTAIDLNQFSQNLADDNQVKLNKLIKDHLKGLDQVETALITGDPAYEIVEYAKKHKMDLIVLGTHARRGLDFAIFGSVARRVVSRSTVPVLTVNPLAGN